MAPRIQCRLGKDHLWRTRRARKRLLRPARTQAKLNTTSRHRSLSLRECHQDPERSLRAEDSRDDSDNDIFAVSRQFWSVRRC
jgi:hypothetical protein